jgi:hypothetical protein
MGEAQGKKVDPSAVAAQAIEAQPSFGQIKPRRGHVARVRPTASSGEDVADKKRPSKRVSSSGEGKETLAYKQAAAVSPNQPSTAPAPEIYGVSSAEAAAAVQSKRCEGSPSVAVMVDDHTSVRTGIR